jgi:hypothetical protein
MKILGFPGFQIGVGALTYLNYYAPSACKPGGCYCGVLVNATCPEAPITNGSPAPEMEILNLQISTAGILKKHGPKIVIYSPNIHGEIVILNFRFVLNSLLVGLKYIICLPNVL